MNGNVSTERNKSKNWHFVIIGTEHNLPQFNEVSKSFCSFESPIVTSITKFVVHEQYLDVCIS